MAMKGDSAFPKAGNAGTSPSDCLVSYLGHSLVGVWPLCRGAVSVFYSPSWLGNRTPELIGQIKNFMDKDHHVSIETISAQFDVSVGTVHTIIREELKMRKICTNFVPRVLREDQKERRCHHSREMVELINSDPAVLDALVTCDESWINCNDPETKRQSSQWKHAGSLRPKKARQSKSTHKLLMIPFFGLVRQWMSKSNQIAKSCSEKLSKTTHYSQSDWV